MSKKEKLLARLRSKPVDFEWGELVTLMEMLGFEIKATGGSARKFIHPETKATLYQHKPHPKQVLKAYQVRDAITFLLEKGYLQ